MPKHLLIFFLAFYWFFGQKNVQGAPAPIQVIGIDFDNNKNNIPAGWNNISILSTSSTIGDLQNEQSQPTGFAMNVTAGFNGSGVNFLSNQLTQAQSYLTSRPSISGPITVCKNANYIINTNNFFSIRRIGSFSPGLSVEVDNLILNCSSLGQLLTYSMLTNTTTKQAGHGIH